MYRTRARRWRESCAPRGLEDRLGVDGVDPPHESRGDDARFNDSGLLSIGGFVHDVGMCEYGGACQA